MFGYYTTAEILIEEGFILKQLTARPNPIETKYLKRRLVNLRAERDRRGNQIEEM